ncbi:hypothetical protein CRG98_013430 [Punica granatum]|uniref:CCHC-type domain-containing protein n=1 Tax=Punica granatum TaxID=22663 RepID=A0A2I0KCB5_PUNGR|nr:hypothetical protein CRG98_013430 [Punica granatum]
MHTHLARLQGLLTEFDEVMPYTADLKEQHSQLEEKAALATESNSSSATSSSTGVAYSHKGHRASKGGKGRGNLPTSTYCGRRGHSREKCYSLCGFPPKVANAAQVQVSVDTDSSFASYKGTPTGLSFSVVISAEDYAQFTHLLQNQAVKQTSHPLVVSFAQSGQPVACLTKSSPIGSWVLDSGAFDHMSGNSNLLSHFHNASSLPSVTLANGFIASDSRTGGTIGTEHEFQGLYRLSASVTSETFGVLVQFLQVKVIVIS